MAKQPEEQNIKSRARRRLIGAVALALAVVVVLPMVLDSEPKVTGQDIDLRIPASDKVGEFVPAVSAVEQVAVEPAASQVGDSAVAVSGKIGKSEVVAETGTADVKPVEVKPVDVKPVELKPAETKKPEAKPVELKKPEAKPVELKKPEAKPAELKPAESKKPDEKADAKKAEPKPAESKKSEIRAAEPKKADAKSDDKASYIVQVGAFSNAATAAQEADKLKGWGFKAYTEQIGGTTRVRVGPYFERGKADEVRALLEKHGQHPVVTAVNGHGK